MGGNIVDKLIEEALIYKKDGKYYSNCAMNEEITIEIKNIFDECDGCCDY